MRPGGKLQRFLMDEPGGWLNWKIKKDYSIF
jgi:hypothetical protein